MKYEAGPPTKFLWYFNHYAQVPGGPGGLRHFSLARGLKRSGWVTYVIAASTELSTGKQREWLELRGEFSADEHDDVNFLWLKTTDYTGNGFGRVRNMLEYSYAARKRRVTRTLPPPSAVIGSTVHPFAALAAYRVARRFGVPFLFEVRDLWPETLIAFGRLRRNSPSAVFLRSLEAFLYKRASKIVSVLPRLGDYVAHLGIPEERVVWIPNGVDTSRYERAAIPSLRENVGKQAPFTFMYLGAHGQANALGIVVKAAAILEKEWRLDGFVVRLVGDGPEKETLRRLAGERALASVTFDAPVSAEDVPRIAAAADVFVISTLKVPGLYRYGISMNKLYDYMAAGRPVIAALDAVNNPIADANCGITVPPEDPAALAEAMRHMMELDSERRQGMGEAGRRHVKENYSYEILARRLADTLDALVGGS